MKFTVGQYCILTELVDREHKRIVDKFNSQKYPKEIREYIFQLRQIKSKLECEEV